MSQSPETVLDAWVSDASALLPTIIDFRLPRSVEGRDFRKDYSPESLADLEGFVLAVFPSRPDYADADVQSMVLDLMRYVGEVFLRAAGGAWDYEPEHAQSGLPYISFDGPNGELTGGRIDLFMLLDQTIELRSGSNLADALARIVENFGDAGPFRSSSVFELPEETVEEGSPLDVFLQAMPEELAAWTGAVPGEWDMSLDSLDRLGELLLQRYATKQDYDERHLEDFLLGAVRYLGETTRHLGAGEWAYAPMIEYDGTATGTPTENLFFVRRQSTYGHDIRINPIRLMRVVIRKQNPGWLRQNVTSYITAE